MLFRTSLKFLAPSSANMVRLTKEYILPLRSPLLGTFFFFVTCTSDPNGGYKNDDDYDTELAELRTAQKPNNGQFRKW